VGFQLTAFSGHRPRYVGRPAALIPLALQATSGQKEGDLSERPADHPESEGPIFVSMTASELIIDEQFRTVSDVEPITGLDASLGDIDEATLDYSKGVLRTGFQQSASFLRILSGLRT
jgi:hypothetical protein